jgi:hypothetical protein
MVRGAGRGGRGNVEWIVKAGAPYKLKFWRRHCTVVELETIPRSVDSLGVRRCPKLGFDQYVSCDVRSQIVLLKL